MKFLVLFALYAFVGSLVCFSLVWLCDEVRKYDPRFWVESGSPNDFPWILCSIFWPVSAFIAYGYLCAKIVRRRK